jgi:(2R)-sulfolactate sulfo-lyase subunit alpha
MSPAALLAHRSVDTVAVAVRDLETGVAEVAFLDGGEPLTVLIVQQVPFGHKVALASIAAGDPIIEYGERVGVARAPISAGELVHVHNMSSARWLQTA